MWVCGYRTKYIIYVSIILLKGRKDWLTSAEPKFEMQRNRSIVADVHQIFPNSQAENPINSQVVTLRTQILVGS